MHLVPKVDRTQVFLVKMLYKLHGWHARRKHDHMHCVGGMLEGGMSMCNVQAAGWRCDHENLHRHLRCYKTRNILIRWGRREKRFHQRFIPRPLCVQLSSFQLSLTLLFNTFWVIKKKELIIYLYISVGNFSAM